MSPMGSDSRLASLQVSCPGWLLPMAETSLVAWVLSLFTDPQVPSSVPEASVVMHESFCLFQNKFI